MLSAGVASPSSLASPTLALPSHNARPVHGVRFSRNDGHLLATCAFDGTARLWHASGYYEGAQTFKCSQTPLLQVDWSSKNDVLLVASSDYSAQAWDVESGRKVAKLLGHSLYVNGICACEDMGAATSSDDGTVRLWDLRADEPCTQTFAVGREVTAVAWSPKNSLVFCGSLDSVIRGFDPRKGDAPAMALRGHADMVTGLAVSPDGKRLLSHALDGFLRVWDVAPFSTLADRVLVKVAHGAAQAADSVEPPSLMRCAWSADGRRFSAGSGTASKFAVAVWEADGRPVRELAGHTGQVIEVAFHPLEPVVASCGLDGACLVGEVM